MKFRFSMIVVGVLSSASVFGQIGDKSKFDGIYRAAKTIQGTSLLGMTQNKFKELQQVLNTEIEILKPKIASDNATENRIISSYGGALVAILDDEWLNELDKQRKELQKLARGRAGDSGVYSVDLILCGAPNSAGKRNATVERLEDLIKKYELATEERTFNAKGRFAWNGTFKFISRGWEEKIAAAAGRQILEANRLVEELQAENAKPKEIKFGMTAPEVEAALGTPLTILRLPDKTVYKYKDLAVEFKDGKVTDIKY